MSLHAWIGRGHGKVILLGEHAAVYGYPALAGAIDRGVTVSAHVAPGPLRLRVPAWGIDVAAGDDHPVARALVAIAAALDAGDGHDLEGDATVPAAAGLGSSAALSVAIARALAAARGDELDDDAARAVATRGEACFHGNPSGIDVALAARGGLVRFQRKGDASELTAVTGGPVPLAIGLSSEPRSTAAMVAKVAAARTADPAGAGARLARLGALADDGVAQVARGDWAGLGAHLDAAHAELAALGVSTPGLDAMVAAARAAGALGAKLTGGGGGGAVIAVAPGREDAVLAAWRALGKDGFVAAAGAA